MTRAGTCVGGLDGDTRDGRLASCGCPSRAHTKIWLDSSGAFAEFLLSAITSGTSRWRPEAIAGHRARPRRRRTAAASMSSSSYGLRQETPGGRRRSSKGGGPSANSAQKAIRPDTWTARGACPRQPAPRRVWGGRDRWRAGAWRASARANTQRTTSVCRRHCPSRILQRWSFAKERRSPSARCAWPHAKAAKRLDELWAWRDKIVDVSDEFIPH